MYIHYNLNCMYFFNKTIKVQIKKIKEIITEVII